MMQMGSNGPLREETLPEYAAHNSSSARPDPSRFTRQQGGRHTGRKAALPALMGRRWATRFLLGSAPGRRHYSKIVFLL